MALKTRFNAELKEVSESYGRAIIRGLEENLIYLGKSASGDLIKSLEVEVVQDDGKSVIRLSAKDYLRWVDQGRLGAGTKDKPGPKPLQKLPNLDSLSKWMSLKGISQRYLFGVAQNIRIKGIKKTDVVKKTLTEVEKEYKQKFDKHLEKIIGVVIVNDIFNQTNTKGQIIPKNLRA